MKKATIFVRLLDEAVDVFRPVEAEERANGNYRIVPAAKVPVDEVWEFPPGAVVQCVKKVLDTGPVLVAVARVVVE